MTCRPPKVAAAGTPLRCGTWHFRRKWRHECAPAAYGPRLTGLGRGRDEGMQPLPLHSTTGPDQAFSCLGIGDHLPMADAVGPSFGRSDRLCHGPEVTMSHRIDPRTTLHVLDVNRHGSSFRRGNHGIAACSDLRRPRGAARPHSRAEPAPSVDPSESPAGTMAKAL